jgi:phosphoribosylglycinamide formyltransferase-1
VSGSGTNLQAILDAARVGHLGAEVRVVISNRPGVRAIERAQAAGVPHLVLPHEGHASRETYDERLAAALVDHRVDLVALAGFMRLLSPRLLHAFPGRVLNIHPSLLPAFPGLHAQRQALDYGAKVVGCTVHFVDEGCDTGPIIAQAAVAVLPEDDEARLSARILDLEHRLYPEAICAVAEGRIRLEGRRVVVAPRAA